MNPFTGLQNGMLPGNGRSCLQDKRKQVQKCDGDLNSLCRESTSTGHPRLFFSAEELQKRLAGEKSPVAKGILDKALKDTAFMKIDIEAIKEGEDRTGDNLVGGPYSRTSVGFGAYGMWMNPMVQLENVITEGSFRYAFIHDVNSREKSQRGTSETLFFFQMEQ